MQVDKTFVRGRTMRVFAEEKGVAPADGWVSRSRLDGNLTFRVEPPDASVFKPYDVTFHTQMKIERLHGGQWVSFDYDDVYRNGHYSAVRNHIRNAADTAPGNPPIPQANGAEIPTAPRARFSCPLPIIHNVEIRMNTVDSLNTPTEYDAVKEYVRWLMNTTDGEKRDLENMRDKHYWYDQTARRFSSFHCAEDRDCVGIYRTDAELDVNGGRLREQFKNVIAMDKDLQANGGVKSYTTNIPHGFFERVENQPGWQNFDMNLKLSKDNLLLVARTAVNNGKGAVLAENAVRIMYNLNETYVEYQYLETDKSEGMETLVEDNQVFVTAEQMNLLISEPITNPFTHSDGQILDKLSDPDFGDIFPKTAYFFVHLQSEMRGEGSLGRDAYSFKPWHITGIQPRQGDRPIWDEEPTIPWRPHHYADNGTLIKDPHVQNMVYKMQLDADKPRHMKPREQRGSGHPDRLHLGGYVGYWCTNPENVGMNGFVVKQRVKPKIRITADNSANADGDKPPGPLVFVIAYSEPKKLVNTDNAANRWDAIKKLEQDFEPDTNSYSRWGGNPKRVS
ncbi:hypothetical protein OS493_028510 [Desmophyllum pertusum]|uniref:Uncharacterized protein n=1 Tax=Desmophyllum pertusum TaxID=174260 RepID=A0A9W9Z9J6_9CNID|nr:hypothetical protein OS493_028510 [Desmophyllum pertusum]